MDKEKRKTLLLIMAGILAALSFLLLLLKLTWPSKEFTAIQSIIENLDVYQDEIESWGYQVSVFDPVTDTPDHPKEIELLPHALLHYVDWIYHPVLILTDQSGGIWFFYNGFDQYAWETKHSELKTVNQDQQQMVEVVTKFWLLKDYINEPPVEFNFAKRGERSYYDMEITIYITGISPETGEPIHIWNDGFYDTQYCSNNFEECKRYGGLDPASISHNANREIKERYTAEQLLDIYRQGLALQKRLIKLSCK